MSLSQRMPAGWKRPQPLPVTLVEISSGPVESLVANSRAGITWSNLLSARSAESPTPATLPPAARRRHTAMATASSGSSNSGGNAAPAPSRYPPPCPLLAPTG